jgi:predicted nucleic acid-binding protein
VLYEYWAVATRPAEHNGLGFTIEVTDGYVQTFLRLFTFLGDEHGIFAKWFLLVRLTRCQGNASHDARLVAAMQRHGILHLLTLDRTDFVRYSGINLLDPLALELPHES